LFLYRNNNKDGNFNMAPAILMNDISKSFSSVLANDRINFSVEAGEIHALLGENGAGKTTLMNVLYGIHRFDRGRIYVFGKKARIRSPKDALRFGIGMVHQHFMLVDRLSVVENVILGTKSPRWPILDLHQAKRGVEKILSQYHFDINLDAKVWQLPVGVQQRVEIVKALFRRVRILILDEPTSVLTPQETVELITILKNLAAQGIAIVFISHKLEEVMSLCDRITVLRKGRVVDTVHTQEVDKAILARMMVGRDVLLNTVCSHIARKEALLDVEGISATGQGGVAALKDVSFKINKGEIFGIAGVDGNGQTELSEVIAGLRRPIKGRIKIRGADIADFVRLKRGRPGGIGYIPENRQKRGLVLKFPVWENLILKAAGTPRFSYKGILFNFRQIKKKTEEMVHLFDIRGPSLETPVGYYSGGNQQKIVLAREFGLNPHLLIAAQPTRGLDVGSIEFVHGQIVNYARMGNGVLLISTELEEILKLSHRFAVIYEGELVGTIENRSNLDMAEIGLMMAGSKRQCGHALF
jgi:simple sugar transport system ATP-binding protein